jgi:hypothetical protein
MWRGQRKVLGCRLAGVNDGNGGVVAGGGRTAGTALAPESPDVPGSSGCSGMGGRRLAGGGGRGSRAGAVSEHQPHRSTARAEEHHGGPAVSAGVAGDAAPPAQGLGLGKSCCLGAASIWVVFHPLLVLHPVADVFGHVLGDMGRCWSSGWSGVIGCVAAAGRGSLGLLVGASGLGCS